MANIDGIIKHIIRWEAGVTATANESMESLFEKARKKGFSDNPLDRGGATMVGITLNTYKQYCKEYHISEPTVSNLKEIPYATWKNVLKVYYWDRYKADEINSQSVANICVDYVWGSGKYGITKVQKALGLTADGIVGPKTIGAINSREPRRLFELIKNVRISHYQAIVAANPSQKIFLKGWVNRVNNISYVG